MAEIRMEKETMPDFFYPLEVVQLRTQTLQSNFSATFGNVRNNGATPHQGWDLYAPVGTRCYAIAAGHVEWIRNQGNYGQQLAIRFNRDGSNQSSNDPLLAFYAHLRPGSIVVAPGATVLAGQYLGETGTSGNASPNAPHLHFEIRTISSEQAGLGLGNRIDPSEVLGHRLFTSENIQIGGLDLQNQMSISEGRATVIE